MGQSVTIIKELTPEEKEQALKERLAEARFIERDALSAERAAGMAEGYAEGYAESVTEHFLESLAENFSKGYLESFAQGVAQGIVNGMAKIKAENREKLIKGLRESGIPEWEIPAILSKCGM